MTSYAPTWVLVADSARARLFQYDGFGAPLSFLQDFEHPASRLHNRDLESDRPGRVAQSHGGPHAGHGSLSGMEPHHHHTAKDIEHEHFARQLASELEKSLSANAFSRLVLVANPEFLGMLRQVASEHLLDHVVASVHKDYTRFTPRELEQHLGNVIHG